jgi:hypothetical protein
MSNSIEYNKEYYKKNKNKLLIKHNIYNKENNKKFYNKEYFKQYYLLHKERINETKIIRLKLK